MDGKQLKNSILQWAIQGKLVPQDPNDEPASVLLERIKAEKEQLIKEEKN
jgi:type I restriction enzyme S subunit